MAHVLAKELREAVLQSAVEGKLSSRHPEDSSINNLTDKLVINPKLESSQIPFDIPEHWRWVQIGNLGESIDTKSFADGPFGSNLKKAHQIESPEVRIIQLSNVGEYSWQDDNIKYTSYEHLKTIERCEVHPGDFVIAKMMPAGRTIIMPNVGTKITLGSDVVKFVPNKVLNKEYLLLAMRSNCFISQVYAEAKGITRVRTSLNKIKSYYLPIPPIEEQQRIVDRVDELIDKIDEYEKLENQLVQLKEQFPKDMRDSLLQAGMMGKLTEHLESDTQICSEFQVKLKDKNKLLPLPDSWKWTNLSLLVDKNDIGDGDWVLSNDMCEKSNNNLIQLGSVGNGVYVDKPFKHVSDLFFESKSCSEVYPEDILISRFISKDRMNVCTVPNLDGRLFTSVDVCWIRNNPSRYCNQWLKMCLLSQTVQRQVSKYVSGTTRPRISKTNLMKIYLPLAPLEEQQRIVDKLDEMLPLVDALAQMD